MGNREALLDGAKRCLLEKGYVKTTARDIAEAAGVSLAAIGYHFGSKESLLEQAFMSAMEEWTDEDGGHDQQPTGSLDQFRQSFDELLSSFPERRPLLRLNIEMGLEGAHNESLGRFMAGAVQHGRLEFAAMFQGLTPEHDEKLTQAVGSFYSALMTGLVAQYLIDPENCPDASVLAEGLQYIAKKLLAPQP